MNAIKKIYNELPETINVPEEFVHKKGEIIFIMEDDLQPQIGQALGLPWVVC